MIDVVVIKFEDDSKCNPQAHLFSLNLKFSIDVDFNSDCQLCL